MAQILYVTNILIDYGALSQLPAECERIGMRHPLVVTDAGVRNAGLLDKLQAALQGTPAAVFDQTPSNPTEAAVRAAGSRSVAAAPSTARRAWPSPRRTKVPSRPTPPSKAARRRSPPPCRP